MGTNEIIIDDGKQTYNIKNQDGEIIGSFRINPMEMNLRKRYSIVCDNLDKIVAEIDTSKNADALLDELEEKVSKEINYLFDSDVASEFFKITSPFSIMANNEFFLVNVINVIGSLIEKETGVRMKKIEKKIMKHTQKYHG